MSAQLDAAYGSQRRRLVSTVMASAAFAWASDEREGTIERTMGIAAGGMAAMVRLTDAYMAAKQREAQGSGSTKGLSPADYTTAVLRGVAAEEVYARPFGAFGGQLEQGVALAVALASARASLRRLVATDIQLAQTHSARDWMADSPRVFGYKRVLSSGKNCPLCEAAARRIYYREDLMPIHERCGCGVSPMFGEHPGGLSVPDAAVRVASDPELGSRLVEGTWAAAA